MEKLTFQECLKYTGITLEEDLEQFYLEFCANPDERPILDRAFLTAQMDRFELEEPHRQRMFDALEEIEADPKYKNNLAKKYIEDAEKVIRVLADELDIPEKKVRAKVEKISFLCVARR